MDLSQPFTSERVSVRPTGETQPRRHGREEELQDQIYRLLARMRIAVIYGGDKSADGAVINATTNIRSWKSYQSVAEDIVHALERLGCPNVSLLPDDMRLGERLKEQRVDLAWLNTGGVQGYSPVSHTPAMMELFGIPYIGHGPLHAAILDNKHTFKRELLALGIATAPFVTWHHSRGPFDPSAGSRYEKFFENNTGPFIVKPVSGRASLHVHFVERVEGLAQIVEKVFEATENHVLIEKFLGGSEYCIAVSGAVTAHGGQLRRHNSAYAFAAVERVLGDDEKFFTSMDVRGITKDRVRPLDSATDSVAISQLESLAQEIYGELGLESLVRLDVRCDLDGTMYALEANPKPDLKMPTESQTSIICEGLARQGMSYDDLILSLLADRLDLLLNQHRGMAINLSALLD